jgi:hypothetical protein
VKAFAIAVLIALVLFVIVHLAGGGFRSHGPSSTGSGHRS